MLRVVSLACAKCYKIRLLNHFSIREFTFGELLLTRNIIFSFLNSIAIFACFVGCGPESNVAKISGTVSIDDKPTENGAISFVPVSGKGPTGGTEIKEGKFTSEAAIGECKVEIRVSKVVGKKKLYDTPDSPERDLLEEVLPAKYNEATELRVEIKKGVNTKDFDLKTK